MIINQHNYVSSVLTPQLAAVHLQSWSKILTVERLRPVCSYSDLFDHLTSCLTCSWSLFLPCSHTSACRAQLLRCWKCLLTPSPPPSPLPLSTPFSLPHKLTSQGKQLWSRQYVNTESAPLCHGWRLLKYETPSVEVLDPAGCCSMKSQIQIWASLTSVMISLVFPDTHP